MKRTLFIPARAWGVLAAAVLVATTWTAGAEDPAPGQEFAGQADLDEATLQRIAAHTGGRYFRATDSATVAEAFSAIDRAQKIEFDSQAELRTDELYAFAAGPGLLLVLAAFARARPGRSR